MLMLVCMVFLAIAGAKQCSLLALKCIRLLADVDDVLVHRTRADVYRFLCPLPVWASCIMFVIIAAYIMFALEQNALQTRCASTQFAAARHVLKCCSCAVL